MQNNEEDQRIRSYDFINNRISNIQEEVDRLTDELIEAKENGHRRKEKEIKKALSIEQKLLNELNRTKKRYIEVRAITRELTENEHEYDRGNIDKLTYLSNKKYLEKKLKKKSKNFSYEYLDEINEQVKNDYSKRVSLEEDDSNSIDIKKKRRVPLLSITLITACILAGLVMQSIDNHPKDIYKDAMPKPDEFSVLMKQMEDNIATEAVPTTTITSETITENNEQEKSEIKPDIPEEEDTNEIRVHYIRR